MLSELSDNFPTIFIYVLDDDVSWNTVTVGVESGCLDLLFLLPNLPVLIASNISTCLQCFIEERIFTYAYRPPPLNYVAHKNLSYAPIYWQGRRKNVHFSPLSQTMIQVFLCGWIRRTLQVVGCCVVEVGSGVTLLL